MAREKSALPVRQGSSQTERPHVTPDSRHQWRAWLRQHHAALDGVWVHFAKKHTDLPTLSYNDAVEEALCFGWIDGLKHPVDGTYYKLLFTPRKPRSAWARSNKVRVERLIAQGLMTRAGVAAIEAAKRNGMWEALDHVEALTEPPELRAAIDARSRARKGWAAFTPAQRKQFLSWLANAKRAETRKKRIREIVALASRGVTPSQAYEVRRRPIAARKA